MQMIERALQPDALDTMRKFFEREPTSAERAMALDAQLRAKADRDAEERDRRNSRQRRRDKAAVEQA